MIRLSERVDVNTDGGNENGGAIGDDLDEGLQRLLLLIRGGLWPGCRGITTYPNYAALALHGDFAVRSVPNLEPIPYKPPKPLVKTSSKPGVGWCKNHKRWRAFTTVAGKCKHLGYFRTEEEAYEAYTQFCAG